ncbi:LANO_0G05226g1_1 [Lachancea nothofagi CBS 11611]|uniref:LANO_0G05226g1_1 n=1 Tax=Lachancea nothofagi CBS 11611 TaxID=1266666 RepID=A0A1G4KGB6_9SACH|nr:LANO_0G05226g1_1 [Lachancea nothofagi CBS 11611]
MTSRSRACTSSEIRIEGLDEVDTYKDKHPFADPGNHSSDHFKRKMSPMRFKMRNYLARYTENQSELLFKWQSRFRCSMLDKYFAYTSLMGSHMFYVVMVPMPRWIGCSDACRDLVYILGYSIYVSGFLKDYWCLPRPKSPPLTRVTLSGYTTKEYGAPSSHTANATGVTMLFLWYIYLSETMPLAWKSVAVAGAFFYYFTLTLGRIYCGMHGILDIVTGALIGSFCFIARWAVLSFTDFDKASMQEWGIWFPILSIAFGLMLLFKHVGPVDHCPCFDDSVAFVGVICGIESSDWLSWTVWGAENYKVYYSWEEFGLLLTLRRIVVGVVLVLVWKNLIGKRLIYSILHLILDDDRHLYVHKHDKTSSREVPLFSGRSKSDLLGRFILYAGVAAVVVLICPTAFRILGV